MQFKTLATILLVCISNILLAQKKLDVTMRGDSVFLENKFQFRAQHKESNGTLLVNLRAPDSSLQAILIFIPHEDQYRFNGRFLKLEKMYDCLYPKMEMTVLFESYIRNKVLVNGVANLEGLNAYCTDRKVELKDIPRKKVMKPGTAEQDSMLRVAAEARLKTMLQVEVYNNAPFPVTVLSGRPGNMVDGKRTFSEKREEMVDPGQRKMIVTFDKEIICVVGSNHQELDCRQVSPTMSLKLSINSKGDGFGK